MRTSAIAFCVAVFLLGICALVGKDKKPYHGVVLRSTTVPWHPGFNGNNEYVTTMVKTDDGSIAEVHTHGQYMDGDTVCAEYHPWGGPAYWEIVPCKEN